MTQTSMFYISKHMTKGNAHVIHVLDEAFVANARELGPQCGTQGLFAALKV